VIEDKWLVYRCKQGHRDALRRIYEKYRDHLLVLAVALGHDVDLAEDALQDTFVMFAEKVQEFKLTGSLKGYLSICVVNRMRDLKRRRHYKTVTLELDSERTGRSGELLEVIVVNEQLQQLSAAMELLPQEQKEVITLHIYSQMRFRAIGQALGLSVNTVKGRYRYGLEKLRSIMDREVKHESERENQTIIRTFEN